MSFQIMKEKASEAHLPKGPLFCVRLTILKNRLKDGFICVRSTATSKGPS